MMMLINHIHDKINKQQHEALYIATKRLIFIQPLWTVSGHFVVKNKLKPDLHVIYGWKNLSAGSKF